MKILIVDCNIDSDSWGAPDLVSLAQIQKGSTVYVRRGPQGDLPSDVRSFDRVIVSGSKTGAADCDSWIDRLLQMIRQTADAQIPFLGVCFGHQMLVRAFGGIQTVRKAQVPEFGWVEVELEGGSRLTRGLPRVFHSFAAHYDEVGNVPPGFRVFARSRDCAIQACQLGDLPIYGIQFHPEKPLKSAEKILAERYRIKEPPLLLNRDQGKLLYREEVGHRIFENFLSGEIYGQAAQI